MSSQKSESWVLAALHPPPTATSQLYTPMPQASERWVESNTQTRNYKSEGRKNKLGSDKMSCLPPENSLFMY